MFIHAMSANLLFIEMVGTQFMAYLSPSSFPVHTNLIPVYTFIHLRFYNYKDGLSILWNVKRGH